MWPTQIVAFVITVCIYGCLCLTRTKRAVLNGDDNPYDLRAALRVLERERRRLELQAIDPVSNREVRFEQQPVIVDSQEDDPDFLARAVAEKGESVFYSADQAKDVENLLRDVQEQKRDENEATEDDLQTVYGHPMSDTEIAMNTDKYRGFVEKRTILKKKAVSGKRTPTKGLDLTAGKRSAEALKSAFSSLTPDEIHKLLLLEGRLQTKDINKRQRKTKPVVVDIRSQPDVDVEDSAEAEDAAAIPISKEELEGLIQAQGEAEGNEDSNSIDDLNQMNDIIQAESAAVDPSLDQPMSSEMLNSALQDLATLEMLQKQEEDAGPEDQETLAQWEQAEMSKLVPILLGAVPNLSQSRQESIGDDDEKQKRKEAPSQIDASTKLSTTPSLGKCQSFF